MAAKVSLNLTGSMDQLRIVWQTGEALLESVPFPEDPEGTRYNILVALQEIVTNVLRHAYDGDEARPLGVEFECDDRIVRFRVRDQGDEFNPLDFEMGDALDGDTMPEQVGGYGIMIATSVMDGIDYARRDGWNELEMCKHVQSSQLVSNG